MAMVHVYKILIKLDSSNSEVKVLDERYLQLSSGQAIKRAYYKGVKVYRDGCPVYYVQLDRFKCRTVEFFTSYQITNSELISRIEAYQKKKIVKEYVSKL